MSHPLTPAMLAMHIAIMGKTGSGKTYDAKGAVEGLLTAGQQVVILDPTSAWWGLRLKPDGKAPAFARVVVMGGRRGDIALSSDPLQAVAVATVVVQKGLSVVLDTGDMTVGERTRWSGRFAETLYRIADGNPLHLVIDEAHVFAPQGSVPDPDAGKMLHAFNALASGGRSRGIRMMAITQRPAKLHKDLLTSCDTIVAHRVVAPQDRKAIEEWVEGCGDKAKARQVLDTLASLKRGEAWLWCPELDPSPHRVTAPAIKTYDSSATPVAGERRDVQMGKVDTDAIGKLISSAGEQIRADDPKALKARIAELEKAARKAPAAAAPSKEQLAGEYQRGYADAEALVLRLVAGEVADTAKAVRDMLAARVDTVNKKYAEVADSTRRFPFDLRKEATPLQGAAAATPRPAVGVVKAPAPRPAPARPGPRERPAVQGSGEAPNGSQHKILDALAWWRDVADDLKPSREAVAFLAGMKPTGGHFNNTLGSCRTAGWVDYPAGGLVSLTAAGNELAGLPDFKTALDAVRSVVDGSQWKIVDALYTATCAAGEGHAVKRADLAEAAGMDGNGGHFNNTVGSLRSAGIIDYPSKGLVALCGWVMGGAA